MGEGGNTGLLKRYSLVLAERNSHQVDVAGSKGQQHGNSGQAKGLAATRLSEVEVMIYLLTMLRSTLFTNGCFLQNVIASPPIRRSLQLEFRC